MTTNTNTTQTFRDERSGRFLTGNNGGGRKIGSRNKLAGALVDALHDDFAQHGIAAIERVRTEDPAAYLRVICAVLPKELDIALDVNIGLFAEARSFNEAYELARQVIDADETKLVELEAKFSPAESVNE